MWPLARLSMDVLDLPLVSNSFFHIFGVYCHARHYARYHGRLGHYVHHHARHHARHYARHEEGQAGGGLTGGGRRGGGAAPVPVGWELAVGMTWGGGSVPGHLHTTRSLQIVV